MSTDTQEIADKIKEQIEFLKSMQELIEDHDRLSGENTTFAVSIQRLTEEKNELVEEKTGLIGQIDDLTKTNLGLQRKAKNFKALIAEKNEENRRLKKKGRLGKKLQQTPQKIIDLETGGNVNSNRNDSNNCKKQGLFIFADSIKGTEHKLKSLQDRCPGIDWKIKTVDSHTPREPSFLDNIEIVAILTRGQQHKHTQWFMDVINKKGIPYFAGNSISTIVDSINRRTN